MMGDVLRETPLYQFIAEREREVGREEERHERLVAAGKQLLKAVQRRYPTLKALATRQLSFVEQPETLEDAAFTVAFAQNPQEAEECLLALGKTAEKHD